MKKVRFLFYSWDGIFKNDHVFKEHGAIIDYFNRHGYDAKMVCIDHGVTVNAHDVINKKVEVKYLKDKKMFLWVSLGILSYLFSLKKLHILILTHFSPKTFLYALWYRLFNHGWKVYVKADFDAERFKNNDHGFLKTSFAPLRRLEKLLVRWFTSLVDLISIETKEWEKLLKEYSSAFHQKLAYIPNGFDEAFIDDHDLRPGFEKKTNSIVTIGRVWTYQKNTEKLLDILKQVDMKDRKAYIIGTIDPTFQETIDIYFEHFPHLREKIVFTWPIYDRTKLFHYLQEAKIYLCTSRFEWFSLVFPELLSQGCYLISTPVSGVQDITDHERLGSILENTEEFVHTLQWYISENSYSKELFHDIVDYAYSHFAWEKHLQRLENLLCGDTRWK